MIECLLEVPEALKLDDLEKPTPPLPASSRVQLRLLNFTYFCDVFLYRFRNQLGSQNGSLLKAIFGENQLFSKIVCVYKLDSNFLSILKAKFNGFFKDLLLVFWTVFYMCCVSGNLRECTFYFGKT